MAGVVDLTSALVDQMLENSRLEMESKLAQAGPIAVATLVDVMEDPDARNSDRISAAGKVLDKVMASPKPDLGEAVRGPTIHITINRLSTGKREVMPIAISESQMDAIEAGLIQVEGVESGDE